MQISDIQNPWRNLLATPASFKSVCFYVESGSRTSGRRTVTHEYPKRNDPYAEDMGRAAVRFQFSGYLIYRVNTPPGWSPYVQQRAQLITALESNDIGTLIHPVHGRWQVMCERYTMTETRERGGYTQFDMAFVQSGAPGNVTATVNPGFNVMSQAGALENFATTGLQQTIKGLIR